MSRAGYFSGRGYTTPALDHDGKTKRRRFLLWRIPLFEFQNDTRMPLTFHRGGIAYQPDNHTFQTDGGSIPPFLWMVPGLNPWDYPKAYPFHDCGYTYGGLYVCGDIGLAHGVRPVFTRMSRETLNSLLCEMIRADGGSMANANVVGAGLAIGSRWVWDAKAQLRARVKAGISA